MIISIANQKGGVGKTTSTYNIATALAMSGKTVAMIDLDPQASLTTDVGFESDEEYFNGKTSQNLFIAGIDVRTVMFPVRSVAEISENLSTKLFLVPSGQRVAVWNYEIYDSPRAAEDFKENIQKMATIVDYVLIDNGPDLGYLLFAALFASDSVIIPVQATLSAYKKLPLLLETIDNLKANPYKYFYNPNLQVLGTIATLCRSNTRESKTVINALQTEQPYQLLGCIPLSSAVTEGVAEGLPVVLYHKRATAAIEYNNIATNLL